MCPEFIGAFPRAGTKRRISFPTARCRRNTPLQRGSALILAFIKRQMPVRMVRMASRARTEKRLGRQAVAAAAVPLDTVAITVGRQMPVRMVRTASRARIVEKRLGGQVVAAAAVRLDTVAITVGRQMPVRMVRMASHARIVEIRLGRQAVAAAFARTLVMLAQTVRFHRTVRMVRMVSHARTLVPPLVLLAAVSASAQMDTVAITARRQTHA